MTWQDVPGIDPTPAQRIVTVAMQPETAVRRHSLILLFRPALIPDCPRWLMEGAFLRAQIGTGELAGQLRIEPMGRIPLLRHGVRGVLRLRLAPPEGCSPERHRQTPVEHDYTDEWFALTLPRWAVGTRPAGLAGIRPTNPRGLIRGFALAQEAAR